VMKLLKPGGALLAFFGAGRPGETGFTKFFIEDGSHLRFRSSPGACGRQRMLENRDILRLFVGLDLFDSVLLRSGIRQVIFRKATAH